MKTRPILFKDLDLKKETYDAVIELFHDKDISTLSQDEVVSFLDQKLSDLDLQGARDILFTEEEQKLIDSLNNQLLSLNEKKTNKEISEDNYVTNTQVISSWLNKRVKNYKERRINQEKCLKIVNKYVDLENLKKDIIDSVPKMYKDIINSVPKIYYEEHKKSLNIWKDFSQLLSEAVNRKTSQYNACIRLSDLLKKLEDELYDEDEDRNLIFKKITLQNKLFLLFQEIANEYQKIIMRGKTTSQFAHKLREFFEQHICIKLPSIPAIRRGEFKLPEALGGGFNLHPLLAFSEDIVQQEDPRVNG